MFAYQIATELHCKEALERRFTIDHKIPLARGGTNDPDNICCACKRCNVRKGTRTERKFFAILAEMGKRFVG